MEPVTAVLLSREREASKLTPTLTYSLIAHLIGVAIIVLAPVEWTGRPSARPETVMSISLGGGPPGPRTGGMTPITAKAIQAAAPAPEVTRRAPITPPAAKTPAMVVPTKTAPKTAPKQEVKAGPDTSASRTPSKGAETRSGSALAETGSNLTGFAGLGTQGGGGTGGYLDVGNFCCPEYIQTMLQLIHRNWVDNQGVSSQNTVKFTIERDGRLVNIEVEEPSQYPTLDTASKRALLVTQKLPPLPSAFTNPTLTVHLVFRYGQ
jgi:TonB family protein